MSKIIVAGGTGFVGKHLVEMLVNKEFEVVVLTRNKSLIQSSTQKISYSYWNVDEQIIDANILTTAKAIINLTGENVFAKRWTTMQKQRIVNSRVNAAKLICKALQENENTVETIINASAIGWYKPNVTEKENSFMEDEEHDNSFLGNTCYAWEQSIQPIKLLNKRLIIFRIGIVLSKEGGMIKEFLKSIKLGIAAIFGNQKISWIHIDDLCNMMMEAIENKNYLGVYNAVAPTVTTNRELNILLAKKLKGNMFIKIKVPSFLLKIILGESSIEVLKSSDISAKKIIAAGYKFRFSNIESTIDSIPA